MLESRSATDMRSEQTAPIGGNFPAHGDLEHKGRYVLLQMKLAALLGHRRNCGTASGGQSGVGIAYDAARSVRPALAEALQEVAPVKLSIRQSDPGAKHGPLAVSLDPNRNQNGAIDDTATMAHLLVTGVEDQIGKFAK